MDKDFTENEKLYRAVYPPEISEIFWRKDGTVSSAAFADPRGLSVDRAMGRLDCEVVESMHKKFKGRIISLFVRDCWEVEAVVKYFPSISNIYHSEIHGGDTVPLLSKHQRKALADRAVVVAF